MPLLPRRAVLVIALAALAVILVPAAARAHAALVSSDPADGATVSAPFGGPIVLAFSEPLRSGSHAELLAAGGAKVADAAIDPADGTRLIFSLAVPLDPGAWTIQWTSIAQDRDIERGQLGFSVAAATASPTVPPSVAPTGAPTAGATGPETPTTPPSPSVVLPSPLPSGSPGDEATASGLQVIVPIVASLALVGAAAAVLLRRRSVGP